MTVALILAALFALLLAGVPVAFALGALGFAMLLAGGFSPLIAPQALTGAMDNFILLAVPLFLLMSNVLLKGGAGRDLFAAAQAWVGHWPGGVAVATVVSCGLFSAVSGSSVATAATIGTVAIPEMLARGYPRKFVFGLLAAGGTLGILIPPSIPMIVYAFITEESVADMFLAGIGPGVLLTFLFSAFAAVFARFSPRCESAPRASSRQRIAATRRALPSAVLAGFIMWGIYGGAFTPTEAGAAGFALSLVITVFWLKTMTWKKFREAVSESMTASAAILIIVACAKIFGKALTLHRIPQDIAAAIAETFSGPAPFIAAVCLLLLVAGLFLEALSMLLVMTPALVPALAPLGLDPIWFGVFFVVMIECALITPPVGLNLYVIQSVGRARMGEVAAGVWPFVALMLLTAGLCAVFPAIVLFIPFQL